MHLLVVPGFAHWDAVVHSRMAKWKSSDTTINQPVAVKNMDPRVVPGPPDFADDDAVGRLKVSFQSQADFLLREVDRPRW